MVEVDRVWGQKSLAQRNRADSGMLHRSTYHGGPGVHWIEAIEHSRKPPLEHEALPDFLADLQHKQTFISERDMPNELGRVRWDGYEPQCFRERVETDQLEFLTIAQDGFTS